MMDPGLGAALLWYVAGLTGQWYNPRPLRYADGPLWLKVLCLTPGKRLDVGAALLQLLGLYCFIVYGVTKLFRLVAPWPLTMYFMGLVVAFAAMLYIAFRTDRERNQAK